MTYHATLCLLLATSALCSTAAHSRDDARTEQVADDVASLPLVEKYQPETFTLGNGLQVVVVEDRAVPLIDVSVLVRVGAKDEPDGRHGFAHMFEHLMFKGTERNPGDYTSQLAKIGVTSWNASTSKDLTSYFQTVPTGALERTLWLEADRMANAVAPLTKALINKEVDIVQNEKSGSDDEPFGTAYYSGTEALYPSNHPYSHPVIGDIDDLRNASKQDVVDWHTQYYGANNMVIALTGDIDMATAKPLVEKHFGNFRQVNNLSRAIQSPVKREHNTVQANYDFAGQSSIGRTYLLPQWINEKANNAMMAAALLAGGEESVLHKTLVDELELAESVSGFISLQELDTVFAINAVPAEGTTIEQLSTAIDAAIAQFLAEGVGQSALDKRYEAQFRKMKSSLDELQDKAAYAGENMALWGDPYLPLRRLNWAKNAKPADVTKAGREWLAIGYHEHRNFAMAEQSIMVSSAQIQRAPDVAPIEARKLPSSESFKLSNGLTVIHIAAPDTSKVVFDLRVPMGQLQMASQKRAVARALNSVVNKGALRGKSGKEQAEANQDADNSVGLSVGQMVTSAAFTAEKKNWQSKFGEWRQLLLNPEYLEEDFAEYQEEAIKNLAADDGDPLTQARKVFERFYEGPENYIETADRIAATNAVTLDEVKMLHQRNFVPSGSHLFVTIDLETQALRQLLESAIGDWTGDVIEQPAKLRTLRELSERPTFILVDNQGSQQTAIAMKRRIPREPGAGYDPTSSYRGRIVNAAFSNGFTSRLTQNIREDKGWVYTSNSGYDARPEEDTFTLQVFAQSDKTMPVVREIFSEIAALRTNRPMTEEELEPVRRQAAVRVATARLDNSDITESYAYSRLELGKPFDYEDGTISRIREFTSEDASRSVQSIIDTANTVWLIVGDVSLYEEDLRAADLGDVLVYTASGELVR